MTQQSAALIPCTKIADFCGVPEQSVHQWLGEGQLKSLISDGQAQVTVADLVDFMHRNQMAIPFELIEYEQTQEKATSVLVIEEDRTSGVKITSVMQELGLKVTQIDNGFEAAIHCLQKKPTLVTLDLGLGDMNSIEFITNLHSTAAKHTKILVISDSMPSVIAKAKAAGADAVVAKPIDGDTLKRAVRILLDL